MSGELQTIPARHGVATFVPRGRTIKIINTYGKQVVSTWAFSLHAPPGEEDGGDEEEETEEEIEKKTAELKEEIDNAAEKDKSEEPEGSKEHGKQARDLKEDGEKAQEKSQISEKEEGTPEEPKEEHEDPPEQAPDTPENEKTTKTTDDSKKGDKKQPDRRTWSSYLPSIPYRSKGKAQPEAETKAEKAASEETSKKWSSYLPTGQGFSSYVPNVQMPDSQNVISAFKASHYRDPNKSYAEQLYDFSKTPVGAGSLAAATGSGTASSLYAAYTAYSKLSGSGSSLPPMEYLSLPHTRAFTHRLVPSVDDTLLTNLRAPILTLIEDTTPGAHDTLTAACDANMYSSLGVTKPEEHGSCAENLVLALKELNEKAGLKGTKAVGADITVNIAPTPLHLFMNAPISLDISSQGEGCGAKGASLSVEEPKGKKRGYVRFRAERDVVVVMSACPMDVGKQNGGKCMAANFMVEEVSEEDLIASVGSIKKKPRKLGGNGDGKGKVEVEEDKGAEKEEAGEGKRGEEEEKGKVGKMPGLRGGPQKPAAVKASADAARNPEQTDTEGTEDQTEKPKDSSHETENEEKSLTKPEVRGGPEKPGAVKASAERASSPPGPGSDTNATSSTKDDENSEQKEEEPKPSDDTPKVKKKPKKLERRTPATTPTKSDT
ncbi:hypothetical protein P154DRAFT_529011 [Amniculicola lignicola CBS 123094]|uniref:DUF1989 domain-containing protein n=1 Tax=Amniculicola lignicola CBS 123094 TaxID=1392246 RepID=A0A6A5X388_9PLEO|nr:hypothetical protein P154DRAFT_529011 [Amniculicola lignicola CBS 123094]